MPLHYGSQIEEHHAVRRDAGMFDVSHMGVVDLRGDRVREFLQRLLANDVGRLKTPGKALYSCMLLPGGGVIDDLIVYFLSDTWFRLVVNAGTRDKDLAWIRRHAAAFAVTVAEQRDLAMIADSGPERPGKDAAAAGSGAACRRARVGAVLRRRPRFLVHRANRLHRRGWIRSDAAGGTMPPRTWDALRCPGSACPPVWVRRDTLRLEAGMNLYGNDMDEDHHPLESGLAWTVAFEPGEPRFHRPRRLSRTLRRTAEPRARRPVARRARRVAQSSESRGGRHRKRRPGFGGIRAVAHRRSNQRHLFSNLESFHCAGARAGNGGHAACRSRFAASCMPQASSSRRSCGTERL